MEPTDGPASDCGAWPRCPAHPHWEAGPGSPSEAVKAYTMGPQFWPQAHGPLAGRLEAPGKLISAITQANGRHGRAVRSRACLPRVPQTNPIRCTCRYRMRPTLCAAPEASIISRIRLTLSAAIVHDDGVAPGAAVERASHRCNRTAVILVAVAPLAVAPVRLPSFFGLPFSRSARV
jgi:hypothetical protein